MAKWMLLAVASVGPVASSPVGFLRKVAGGPSSKTGRSLAEAAPCSSITDLSVCCLSVDGGDEYTGDSCVPAVEGSTFTNGNVCAPTKWLATNLLVEAEFVGTCPTAVPCSAITDLDKCCMSIDGSQEFMGDTCIPAVKGSQFTNGNVCAPAKWIATELLANADFIGSCPEAVPCSSIKDLDECCQSVDGGNEFTGDACIPAIEGYTFTNGNVCAPAKWLATNLLANADFIGTCATTTKTTYTATSTLTVVPCSSITDLDKCCVSVDGGDEFTGNECIPAAKGYTFTNGNVCAPAKWIATNLLEEAEFIGTCPMECSSIKDLDKCCVSVDGGDEFFGDACIPAVEGYTFTNGNMCAPAKWIATNLLANADFIGTCPTLTATSTLTATTTTIVSCSAIMDVDECCGSVDTTPEYFGNDCIPAAEGYMFTNGKVCAPAHWIAINLLAESPLIGTCPASTTTTATTYTLGMDVVVGEDWTNECPYGSVRMGMTECYRWATYRGAKMWEISSSEDPVGCFHHSGNFYFNTHPTGARRSGRTPHCKAAVITTTETTITTTSQVYKFSRVSSAWCLAGDRMKSPMKDSHTNNDCHAFYMDSWGRFVSTWWPDQCLELGDAHGDVWYLYTCGFQVNQQFAKSGYDQWCTSKLGVGLCVKEF